MHSGHLLPPPRSKRVDRERQIRCTPLASAKNRHILGHAIPPRRECSRRCVRSVAPVASRAVARSHGRCSAGPAYPVSGVRDQGVLARRRARHADSHRRARTELLAAVRALSHRRRARAGDEPDQRAGNGSLLQPIARHARTVWIVPEPESLRADSPPRVVPTPVTGGTGDSARRRGGTGAREARHRDRLLDRRDEHAGRPAARARAARLARPRHRVGVSASARRRAARGHDRRRLHGRVLVSADRRLRRRHRMAERSVPRRRRVLHGVRGLRREYQRAARLAGRGDGRVDERETTSCRSKRETGSPKRDAIASVVHVVREQDRGAGTQQSDEHRVRRRAHLALSRAQRARLRLGRVGEVSVGRDRRRRRRSRRRRTSRTRRRSTRSIGPRRASGRGTDRASTSGTSSSFCRTICGRTRGRR